MHDTVLANHPITVKDLLTFRCGLGMILAPPGRYPIQKAIADLGINGVGFGPPDPALSLDGNSWLQKIGSLPLFAQPGEDWLYTAGSNIQGRPGREGLGSAVVAPSRNGFSARWG